MSGGSRRVMVQASDLRDLLERAVTLSYVIRADQDVLGRLDLARQRAAAARAGGGGRPAGGSGRRCDLSGTSAAERWIILRESSGDPTADNPASTAFGLGQLLLGNRILYLGQDYATT